MPLYLPDPIVFKSGVSVVRNSVNGAGDAVESQLVAVTLPPIGPNGWIRSTAVWTYTNSSSTKTLRVRFGAAGAGLGGTAYHSGSVTTTVSTMQQINIANRNATNSQFGGTLAGTGGWGASASSTVTTSIDTTAPTEIYFGCLWSAAASAENITLQSYLIEVFPR